MTLHLHPPRHHRVWLSPGWRGAMRVELARGALADVEAWLALGRPAVAARNGGAPPGTIALGIALPGDGKRRVSLVVDASAVTRVEPPLELGAVIASAPAPWRARLHALDADARAAGVALGIYGSLAWQHLSGEPYVTSSSDVDLLAPAATEAQLHAALSLLGTHAGDREPALDGELLLPGGRAVSWREVLSGGARLLVKSDREVTLEPAAAVLAFPPPPREVVP